MPRRIVSKYGRSDEAHDIIELKDKPEHEFDGEYVICPYCGTQMGDCWEWVTESSKTDTCEECGGEYRYYAETYTTYYTDPVTPPPNPHEREVLDHPADWSRDVIRSTTMADNGATLRR